MQSGIIKQIQADIEEARATEEIEASEFPDAEREARKLGLVKEAVDSKSDVARITSYWRGKAASKTDAELRDAIGNDLEQLDYPPEEVAKLVPRILKAVKK